MRDANRPRLRDYAYGQRYPGRLHVVVRRDPVTRFAVWRGTRRLREFVEHERAMTWARKVANPTHPKPMEAP